MVILYNLKHKMPLMYFDRTRGGDIGWPDSSKWRNDVTGVVSGLATFTSDQGREPVPVHRAAFADAAEAMMRK